MSASRSRVAQPPAVFGTARATRSDAIPGGGSGGRVVDAGGDPSPALPLTLPLGRPARAGIEGNLFEKREEPRQEGDRRRRTARNMQIDRKHGGNRADA